MILNMHKYDRRKTVTLLNQRLQKKQQSNFVCKTMLTSQGNSITLWYDINVLWVWYKHSKNNEKYGDEISEGCTI